MATFQNNTMHPIPIMLNGIRKTIRPGEQFSGPESLSAIPGIIQLGAPNRTVLVKQATQQPLVFQNTQPVQQVPKPAVSGSTNLSTAIDEELAYLTYMKGLGSNPSVTLAILTKNRLELIRNCCESIFTKVQYQPITLMIIDTGTNEQDVRSYYATLEKRCVEKKWKYKFVQLDTFHYSKNYNTAIRNHVDTEYVLIQNNDTVALNDYVTEMMRTAMLKPVGSVGCRMLYPDQLSIQHDGQTIFNAPHEQFGSASHIHLRHKKDSVPKKECLTHFVDGNTAAGVLMRTKEFLQIGGFDEHFGDIFQDVHMMIKIPQILNKYNYCNRIASIIHIDNASRLHSGVDQKKHVQMWEDTHYLRKELIEHKWSKLKRPPVYDFTIITPVYDLDNYRDFAASLRSQIGSHSVELLAIPNFYNIFDSAYKALNIAGDIANGKIIIYCHDDIVVNTDWLQRIKNKIQELENAQVPIGVLGPAGITKNEEGVYFLVDENNVVLPKFHKPQASAVLGDKTRYEVQTLDELCLITLKKNNLRFDDELLSGWHFYGANICFKALLEGLHNFVIDAFCHHKSDGTKNIDTMKKWNTYEQDAKNFDAWSKTRGIINWRTTTAKSASNILHLFPKKPTS